MCVSAGANMCNNRSQQDNGSGVMVQFSWWTPYYPCILNICPEIGEPLQQYWHEITEKNLVLIYVHVYAIHLPYRCGSYGEIIFLVTIFWKVVGFQVAFNPFKIYRLISIVRRNLVSIFPLIGVGHLGKKTLLELLRCVWIVLVLWIYFYAFESSFPYSNDNFVTYKFSRPG